MSEQLKPNPFARFEDKIDAEIPTAVLAIYEQIQADLARTEEGSVDRCSAANYCVRRRYYQFHGVKGAPLTPRKIINFTLGDLSEKVVQFFIKKGLVGPGKLYSQVSFGRRDGSLTIQGKKIESYAQKTLSFKIRGGPEIRGHADGFGKRNSDGKWELIEIKSAADFGFDEFKFNGPGDYLKQAHAVMLTKEARKLGVKQVRFFYLRKGTGHLWDRVFDFDDSIARQVIEDFKTARKDECPDRPYSLIEETVRKKPTGRLKLPWQCGYCPFTEVCWADHHIQIEFKGDSSGMSKPVHILTKKEEVPNAV